MIRIRYVVRTYSNRSSGSSNCNSNTNTNTNMNRNMNCNMNKLKMSISCNNRSRLTSTVSSTVSRIRQRKGKGGTLVGSVRVGTLGSFDSFGSTLGAFYFHPNSISGRHFHFASSSLASHVNNRFLYTQSTPINTSTTSSATSSATSRGGANHENTDSNIDLLNLQQLDERTNELLDEQSSTSTSGNSTSTNTNTTLMHFDQVMEAWSRQQSMYAAQRSEELLIALERNYDRLLLSYSSTSSSTSTSKIKTIPTILPNSISYNHVIQAYAQSQGGEQAAIKAEEILNRMIKQYQTYDYEHRHLLSSSSSPLSPSSSSSLIDSLLQRPPPPPEPILSTFHTVMNAWSKSNSIHAGHKAEEIYTLLECYSNDNDHDQLSNINQQKYQHQHRQIQIHPNAQSLAIVFDAWANSSNKEAMDRVLTTLNHVIDRERQHERQRKMTSTKRAEKLITQSGNNCDTDMDIDMDTDIDYGTDIDNGTDPRRAYSIRLNKIVFHSILLTLANAYKNKNTSTNRDENGLDIAMKAQEVFNLLHNLHESGFYHESMSMNDDDDNNTYNNDLKPNTRTWSLLLRCWTNAVNHSDVDGGENAAQHADSILRKMEELYNIDGEDVKPNSYSFTSCIHAWAKCKSEKGALRAMEILARKEKMYSYQGITTDASTDAGTDASTDASTSTTTGNDDHDNDHDSHDLKPNTYEYNVCLSALCAVENGNLLKEARKLLSKMVQTGVADTVSFNTMMSAYIKANDSHCHLHIWDLFEEMKQLQINLDIISYNTAMDAVGRSRDPDSIDKVIQMLEAIIERSKENDPELDSKSSSITTTTTNTTMPSVRSFTTVLNAIAKSQLNEKAEPARKVFRQLITLYDTSKNQSIKPDVAAFGAFMSCCANQGGSNERKRYALRLALGTYEQLCKQKEYGKPNEYIYGSLLKACGRLTQDENEKSRLLETLFISCRDEGQVSRPVLNMLLKIFPKALRDKLLKDCMGLNKGKSRGTYSSPDGSSFCIPIDWCCNVSRRNRPISS